MVQKPREFWIELGGDPSDDKEVYKRYCATTPFKAVGLDAEVVHFVEYAAYEDLKAKLEKAVEALEFYASQEHYINANSMGKSNRLGKAIKALKEIKDEK